MKPNVGGVAESLLLPPEDSPSGETEVGASGLTLVSSVDAASRDDRSIVFKIRQVYHRLTDVAKLAGLQGYCCSCCCCSMFALSIDRKVSSVGNFGLSTFWHRTNTSNSGQQAFL